MKMRALTVLSYSLSSLLSLAILSSSVLASGFANIQINGESVPEDFFHRYGKIYSDRLCPPASDAYLIQEVVKSQLLVDEGIRQGVVPHRPDARVVEALRKTTDNMLAGTAVAEANYQRYRLFEAETAAYGNAMAGQITLADSLARYRQLILDKDPRLVNVTLLKIVDHRFTSKTQRDLALAKLAQGQSIESVIASNDFGAFNPFQADRWVTVEASRVLRAENAVIQAGTVFVPDWDPNTTVVRIVDTRVISRIRPFQVMDGTNDRYAQQIAFDDVRAERLATILEPVLEKVLITRNEEPMTIGGLQAGCDAD